MESVTGVFQSRTAAEEGVAELLPLGIPKDRITILTPEATKKELAAVPTVEAEQPGMGKALGAAVGGAVGLAGGMGAAGAVMSALVPGVGPVLAVGLAGAALLGTIGAATGGAIEKSLSDGLPSDELFIYEDALRQGRTVLVAMVDGSRQAEADRGALENAGAESIDGARHMWWLGVRDVEKEKYERTGGDFENETRAIFVVVLKPPCTRTIATNPTKSVAISCAIGIRTTTRATLSGGAMNAEAPTSQP